MVKRKSFREDINPAMQFINTSKKKTTYTQIPDGYKLNPMFVETKSRRLQLLLKPSLYDKIKQYAKEDGKSVNDFIHSALEELSK